MVPIRWSKIVLVGITAIYMFLIVFNNVTDYPSNFAFVSHVMSMDDTFAATAPGWRAITSGALHHFFYATIILTEAIIMLLCALGTVKMWIHRSGETQVFDASKKYAIYGLTLGLSLWFLGFIAVGGEWFLMWQSGTWNGNPTAFSNAILFGVILVYLSNNN